MHGTVDEGGEADLGRKRPHGNRGSKASDEEQVLKSLLISAAESDRIDRIRAIHGFEKDDVLHCLPCEHFVPGSDWDELLELHSARSVEGGPDFGTYERGAGSPAGRFLASIGRDP